MIEMRSNEPSGPSTPSVASWWTCGFQVRSELNVCVTDTMPGLRSRRPPTSVKNAVRTRAAARGSSPSRDGSKRKKGAAFAFAVPEATDKDVPIVDSLTLSDFVGTDLADHLAPYAGQPIRVGLAVVWTEAKITFLAYELRTRYPAFRIAVCSALTASSSRARHFEALDQLTRILGVEVLSSVGGFVDFLCGDEMDVPLPDPAGAHPTVDVSLDLDDTDRRLLRYLYRDCRSVRGKVLDGGFSGNVVLGTNSVDLHGHDQSPHVVKIGPRKLIGKERTSFERIETVLGNIAPRIADFADLGERGAYHDSFVRVDDGLLYADQASYTSKRLDAGRIWFGVQFAGQAAAFGLCMLVAREFDTASRSPGSYDSGKYDQARTLHGVLFVPILASSMAPSFLSFLLLDLAAKEATVLPILVLAGCPGGNARYEFDYDGDGGDDCDDSSPLVYPGATEYADQRDNNCNGQTDEGTDLEDLDSDGYMGAAGIWGRSWLFFIIYDESAGETS